MILLILITINLIVNIINLCLIIRNYKRLENIDFTEIIDNLVTENSEMRTQLQEILYKEVN